MVDRTLKSNYLPSQNTYFKSDPSVNVCGLKVIVVTKGRDLQSHSIPCHQLSQTRCDKMQDHAGLHQYFPSEHP